MTIIKSTINTMHPNTIFDVKINALSLAFNGVAKNVIRRSLPVLLTLALTMGLGANSYAAESILAESYPDRYTVQEGDTLWEISGKFLRDPWRWPEVWQGNPQVENPDLIFPGDVLVLTFIEGRPILKALRREAIKDAVKLSPSIRVTRLDDAIPLIDPAAIAPYINSPLVTNANEMRSAPYVVDGLNSRLVVKA